MQRILRTIGLSLFLIVLANVSQAQLYQSHSIYTFDYLYLRDSTVISGWIVEQKVGEYVKIELIGGSVLVVEQSKISEITRERSPYAKILRRPNAFQVPINYRPKGIYHLFDFHLGFPQGENGNPVINPAFHYRLGYRWNRWLGTGVGTGLDLLHAGLVVPVFGELTGYLWDRPKSPFYSIQAGYGLPLTSVSWQVEGLDGGVFYQGMIGIQNHRRQKTHLSYSIGWKAQYLDIQRRAGWDWVTGDPIPGLEISRPYQSLIFQIGIGI